MPNENASVCRCNFAEDAATKARGTIFNRKSNRAGAKNGKHEKRVNHRRRTRSAERAESHYTYIDSGSSIGGSGIRENAIAEAIYATISDDPYTSIDETTTRAFNPQRRHIYAIPSMTSPPPTYDMAIAEKLQSGLPPTYDECLCHKHSSSRSHTPPPPWSESAGSASTSSSQGRRELLASQPDLHEHLSQFSKNVERKSHGQSRHGPPLPRDNSRILSQQAQREQHARAQQRTRQIPTRSQSETRAEQQRMAMKQEYGAFCMETAVLQTAIEQGIAICSLM